MKSHLIKIVVMLLAVAMMAPASFARRGEKTETFDGCERIDISTVSGDVEIRQADGDQIEVTVEWSYSPRGSYQPEMEKYKSVLRIDENMRGSNSGHSTWTILVPSGIEIDFESASGGLVATGMDGKIRTQTASGDIELENCSGRFDLQTASGDVDLIDCKGEFDVSVASGDIDARGMQLETACSFTTASGRASVTLAESLEHDLTVSTASGRALLDLGGFEARGYFEMVAKVRSGRIDCPLDFDDEERFRQWDQKYVRKSFTRETDSPEVFIKTASGRAVLRL
ncbi:MAG: DUF4097 family beta strand repeat-containing protein [candidate division Zixibacteria bacterium]